MYSQFLIRLSILAGTAGIYEEGLILFVGFIWSPRWFWFVKEFCECDGRLFTFPAPLLLFGGLYMFWLWLPNMFWFGKLYPMLLLFRRFCKLYPVGLILFGKLLAGFMFGKLYPVGLILFGRLLAGFTFGKLITNGLRMFGKVLIWFCVL